MALKYTSNIFLISRLIKNIKNEKIKLLNFNDFDAVSKELNNSIIISTAPPDEQGNDPVLLKYGNVFKSINSFFGYISSTSVYGEGFFFEEPSPTPNSKRGKLRILVENKWLSISKDVKIFRSGGIYGQNRHPMIKFLNGKVEVVTKLNHYPNRIHVKDLSSIILESLITNIPAKFINITDQNSISSYEAIKFVTETLNLSKPIEISYEVANMSDMARLFFKSSKIIRSSVIKDQLKYKFLYPDYKKALLELTKEFIENQN